jgi:hypothetical protein
MMPSIFYFPISILYLFVQTPVRWIRRTAVCDFKLRPELLPAVSSSNTGGGGRGQEAVKPRQAGGDR